jgi:hypothetical protein
MLIAASVQAPAFAAEVMDDLADQAAARAAAENTRLTGPVAFLEARWRQGQLLAFERDMRAMCEATDPLIYHLRGVAWAR